LIIESVLAECEIHRSRSRPLKNTYLSPPVFNLASVKHNEAAIKMSTTLAVIKARKVAHFGSLVRRLGHAWYTTRELTLIKSNCVKSLIEYLSIVIISGK
jgi:hypothetical protein